MELDIGSTFNLHAKNEIYMVRRLYLGVCMCVLCINMRLTYLILSVCQSVLLSCCLSVCASVCHSEH
jgi:hypothetical protein